MFQLISLLNVLPVIWRSSDAYKSLRGSPLGSLHYSWWPQTHAPGPALFSRAEDGNLPLLPHPETQSSAMQAASSTGDTAFGMGKGMLLILRSLTRLGTTQHVPTAHLWSLQGGLEVLLGHPFLCHQEAPGHLGVLVDQGGQWLHLDLDHPGRSSHRHGEMKQHGQAQQLGIDQRVPTTHALHPQAMGNLISVMLE